MTLQRTHLVAGTLIGLLALVALGVFAIGSWNNAAAQAEPAAPAATLPRTITVVGEGTVATQPDIAQIQVGVEVAGDNAQDASAEAAEAMQAILDALKEVGIAAKDIQTSGYNIFVDRPMTPAGIPGREVVYRVNNTVSVTVRDLDSVGDVLGAVIEAGANNIYGVNFSLDDPDEVMAEARAKAAEDALARAEELAGLHGVALGEVVSVSEVIGGMGLPAYDSVNASIGMGSGGGPIMPGEMKMTARLQVVYAIAGPAAD